MTKPRAKAKIGVDAPVPDYNAPSIAVRRAVENLLGGKDPVIEIDVDAYNEIAWELVTASHERPSATKKQALAECEEIKEAAWKLIRLLAEASLPTFAAIDGHSVDGGMGPMLACDFDFTKAQFTLARLIQASGKAPEKICGEVAVEGLKGRGQKVDTLIDKISDMIARDFWLLTYKPPGLNNPLGYKKSVGPYAEFFRHIFLFIFPDRDFVTPAREAAARWKTRNKALLEAMKK